MFSRLRRGRHIVAAAVVGLSLLFASSGHALAHARYDHSDLPPDSMVDGQPFTLKAYFSQEMTSKSTMTVVDANGTQVDNADGHLDLDDPDRKVMVVTLPALPTGVYTVQWNSVSAEDGDSADGTFAFGVGMAPPSADQPAVQPADDDADSGMTPTGY
jgi:methionine-rich copper-binding protein CopC